MASARQTFVGQWRHGERAQQQQHQHSTWIMFGWRKVDMRLASCTKSSIAVESLFFMLTSMRCVP